MLVVSTSGMNYQADLFTKSCLQPQHTNFFELMFLKMNPRTASCLK